MATKIEWMNHWLKPPIVRSYPDWNPRRRGGIYCSPACGGKCTYAAFVAATKRARALCKRLGEGWEPKVSENLGWHCAVENAAAQIDISINLYEGGKTYYRAMMGHRFTSSSSRSAADAVRRVIADAKAARADLDELIRGALLFGSAV